MFLLGSNIHVGNLSIHGGALPPFTASDNFGGLYPNSGSVGDSSWTRRGYAQTKYSGTPVDPTITGGALRYVMSSTEAMYTEVVNIPTLATGSLQITIGLVVEYTGDHFVNPTVKVGASNYAGGFKWVSGVKYLFVAKDGADQWTSATAATSTDFKVSWDGVNVSLLIDGTSRFSEANASSATNFYPFQVDQRITGGSSTTDFDDLIVLDGSGDPILI